jgi:hypothetical protein
MEQRNTQAYIGMASDNGRACSVAVLSGNHCQELATFTFDPYGAEASLDEVPSSNNSRDLVRAILCHHLSCHSPATVARQQADQFCSQFHAKVASLLARDLWRLSSEDIDCVLQQISESSNSLDGLSVMMAHADLT